MLSRGARGEREPATGENSNTRSQNHGHTAWDGGPPAAWCLPSMFPWPVPTAAATVQLTAKRRQMLM